MLETEIKKLTATIEALTATIEALTAAMGNAPAEVEAPVKDETPVEVTPLNMDDLTRKCLALSRDGKRDEIKVQLASHGVGRVTELEGDKLTAFAAWVDAQ